MGVPKAVSTSNKYNFLWNVIFYFERDSHKLRIRRYERREAWKLFEWQMRWSEVTASKVRVKAT